MSTQKKKPSASPWLQPAKVTALVVAITGLVGALAQLVHALR